MMTICDARKTTKRNIWIITQVNVIITAVKLPKHNHIMYLARTRANKQKYVYNMIKDFPSIV